MEPGQTASYQCLANTWKVDLILIYLLNKTELTPGGSSTIHIYTKTTHRTTQLTTMFGRFFGIRTHIYIQ